MSDWAPRSGTPYRATWAASTDSGQEQLPPCPRCGHQVEVASRFCPACGLELGARPEPVTRQLRWPAISRRTQLAVLLVIGSLLTVFVVSKNLPGQHYLDAREAIRQAALAALNSRLEYERLPDSPYWSDIRGTYYTTFAIDLLRLQTEALILRKSTVLPEQVVCAQRLIEAAEYVASPVWRGTEPTGAFYELSDFNDRIDRLTAALATC